MTTFYWALAVSLVISLISGPIMIPMLKRLKFGQYIRLDGPQKHMKKAGTPTIGGLIFLLSITVATLIFYSQEPNAILALIMTISFGLLGFLDDFIKVVLKRPLGLKAREKLAGQFLLAFFLVYYAMSFGRGSDILLPFLGYKLILAPWLYIIFTAILVVGMDNAVNLTDGLDGLATGITIIVALAYVLITYFTGRLELMGFAGILAASLLGFLFFNRHPAKVFMGDTGSLALGGALASLAVLSKTELVLIIVGGVYIVEMFSVIIQVISFQLTGKRVFKMSPLHHHYELKGWSEKKVVLFFWMWAVIWGVVGLFGLINII